MHSWICNNWTAGLTAALNAFRHILYAALLTGMDGYKLLMSTVTIIASSGTVKSCRIRDNDAELRLSG